MGFSVLRRRSFAFGSGFRLRAIAQCRFFAALRISPVFRSLLHSLRRTHGADPAQPRRADGTVRDSVWERRTLPDLPCIFGVRFGPALV
jgi:hypothetical protein